MDSHSRDYAARAFRHVDSDDSIEGFDPPALSDYAQALLAADGEAPRAPGISRSNQSSHSDSSRAEEQPAPSTTSHKSAPNATPDESFADRIRRLRHGSPPSDNLPPRFPHSLQTEKPNDGIPSAPPTRSAIRVKRFGRGLGPPQRGPSKPAAAAADSRDAGSPRSNSEIRSSRGPGELMKIAVSPGLSKRAILEKMPPVSEFTPRSPRSPRSPLPSGRSGRLGRSDPSAPSVSSMPSRTNGETFPDLYEATERSRAFSSLSTSVSSGSSRRSTAVYGKENPIVAEPRRNSGVAQKSVLGDLDLNSRRRFGKASENVASMAPVAPVAEPLRHFQPTAPHSHSHSQILQPAPPPQPHPTASSAHFPAAAPPADPQRKPKGSIVINGAAYQRLELIGRGGSSKVYKVMSESHRVYAVKKVVFEDRDAEVVAGFKGEIDLLLRLRDQERVVRLVDYALRENSLYLVMECGEIDLAHVLATRLGKPLDLAFVRFHAREMLLCVRAVHSQGIVHSDLKPANFLFVKGMLKIIDFGIANAVPEYTANVYRDTQIGTPNYMAPEALLDVGPTVGSGSGSGNGAERGRRMRVGKPSDVWSCGCILYQMVYGRPPYGAFSGAQRMLAIMNPQVSIEYPAEGMGGSAVPPEAVEAMRQCLARNPSDRWTVEEVLDSSFLSPRVLSKGLLLDLVENSINYGIGRKSSVTKAELQSLTDDIWAKISEMSTPRGSWN